MHRDKTQKLARRTFLSRLTAAAAAFGALSGTAAAGQAPASGPTPSAQPPSGWQPARHPEDDWYDQTAAKHRFFLDTTSPETASRGMAFARNFFEANASGYGLTDADIAQIICLRHQSTAFAFTDAMWAKYSEAFSERSSYVDPDTKKPSTVNPYEAAGKGLTLSALAKRGVRYAVCGMATRRIASTIAGKTGGKVDDIYKELTEHLVPNGHMVAAGIVAVNRAQERGYTSTSVVP